MRRTFTTAALVTTSALIAPASASAHAGIGGRQDLPIPEWLFAWAASVVLVVSFIGLATLWKQPKLEGAGPLHKVPWQIGMVIVNPVTEAVAGLIGVFLLFLTIWAGLAGTSSPTENIAPTFVFVVFWVGLVPISLIFGDLFRAFNPWRAIGRATGWVMGRFVDQMPRPLTYPHRLGRWPAILTILLFTGLELVNLNGQLPETVGTAALIYTIYTLLAMAVFGTEQWVEKGEGFSVYFNMFSRVSPLYVEDRELRWRAPLRGLTTWEMLPGTVMFVITAIGTITFDGASEGPVLGEVIGSIQDLFTGIGLDLATAGELARAISMLIAIAFVAGIYALGILGVRSVDRRGFKRDARTFGHTLVPIAAAYVLAHYFSYLVFNGQAMIYLISDPLGRGSNIFGTVNNTIDFSVLSGNTIWYVQVAALVIGHVAALTLAHDRALAIYDNVRTATRSQYWMLAVMIGFTTFGLWLLSQSNA